MKYVEPQKSQFYAYPDHNIDPSKKDAKWCMQYAKAAYRDFSFGLSKGVFGNNQGNYQKNRMYALGKQSITQYQGLLGINQQNKATWLSIDWTVRPVISGYRDRAIARLMKESYDIVATAVDSLAKDEELKYYAEMKAKLMIRQLAMQAGDEEIANHPMIQPQKGEPMDIEELEMRMTMGEQFNRSKDAELAVELAFFENKYNFWRREVYEDLFDYGVTGYREWLGTDNKPHFRRVNPEDVIVSYCRKADFSDKVHAGEIIDVSLVDLAAFKDENGNAIFTDEELQEFASSIAGRYGNPTLDGRAIYQGFRGWDKFKCKVLDLEFYSYDRHTYRNTVNENGNLDFRKADYGRGETSEKYIRKTYKMVYKCKWVIGTDKVYDYGLAYDQKRSNDPKKYWDTRLSFEFIAMNFYEMTAQSIMDRVIPYIDKLHLAEYKLQNAINRYVPAGWWIDLEALENVALNKGGKAMEPKELLQMYFETGVLMGRSKDAQGNPMAANWKPVIPISNTDTSDLMVFHNDIRYCLEMIQTMTGYNMITDGNPNPKTLVPGYELANESTNDALYPMAAAETILSEKLAYDVLKRTQQGIKKGGVEGYSKALNINMLRIIEISPDICTREYGVMLEKKSTEQEKAMLLQIMQQDITNGLLDSSDAIMLINTHNVKQAQMIWSYRVKRAKEMLQQQELQKIQLNNEGAKEAAMIAQQQAAAIEQQRMQFELQKEQMKYQFELQKLQMTLDAQANMNLENNMTKLEIADVDRDGRVGSASVQGQAKMTAQQIASQAKLEGDRIKAENVGNEKK